MNKVRGLKKSWHKNGSIKEVFYTLNGKKDGEYKAFHEDGSVHILCTYRAGKIDGTLQETDKNINRNLEFKNGVRHGNQFEYLNDKLVKKYNCYKGALNGEYCSYGPNEELVLKCSLIDNKLHGKLVSYENGLRKAFYNYKNNKLHGECIKYDLKSQTAMVGYFCDGLPIKKWREVDKNGVTIKDYVSGSMLAKTMFENTKWNISMGA